ncbi:MAG TPA: hypothetical protein VE053_16320 [Allosphingosinicella sp.]|nr:hypothetical protein [Allosphingosinicella sp.]
MFARQVATLLVFALPIGGCSTRWQPETGKVRFTRACPQHRAPHVGVSAPGGLRGAYSFVTQDASAADLSAWVSRSDEHGFAIVPITVKLNGLDTVFATGPGVLVSQEQVDAEFETACRLQTGRIYLTHVRYNPVDENRSSVQVR